MRKKPPLIDAVRLSRGEDMFVSTDTKSMRRGRRVAPRTGVCRPCLVWLEGAPEETRQAVIMDLNPYGMKVRMFEPFEVGAEVCVRMMRDEEFQVPLSPPIEGRVVRAAQSIEGFVDHGVKLRQAKIPRAPERRMAQAETARPRRNLTTRMYTIDFTVDERGVRRTGRRRG